MKEEVISTRKAGEMWGVSVNKSILTQVRLNRRVTFDRRIEIPSLVVVVVVLTKDEGKKPVCRWVNLACKPQLWLVHE